MESDDDEGGCCHWSKENHSDLNTNIQVHSASPEYGKPSVELEVNSRPHDLVELAVDDNFIDISIEATNEHAANDRSFQKYTGNLEKNDKSRALIRRFLAIKWHLGLVGYSQKEWAWSEDPLKKEEVKKVLMYRQFKVVDSCWISSTEWSDTFRSFLYMERSKNQEKKNIS